MTDKPTTGKVSIKPYKCDTCGHEAEFSTNHWGRIYNTPCRGCGPSRSWSCTEPCPPTHDLPPEWTTVKLRDIIGKVPPKGKQH